MSCCCLIAICFMSFAFCYSLINCFMFLIIRFVCFLVLYILLSSLCLCFVTFCVLFLPTYIVVLYSVCVKVYRPRLPGGNPIEVNKYHIKYVITISMINTYVRDEDCLYFPEQNYSK
jgi:hypothetical protein